MKNKSIAYCGLNCEKCEAYIATKNNDNDLRIKVAEKWSKLNGIEILPEQINCEGCRMDGVKTVFCDRLCEIRQCGLKSGLSHCGKCSKLLNCEKNKMIIDNNDEALNNLKNND